MSDRKTHNYFGDSTLISKLICVFTQIDYPKKQLELSQ